MIEFKPKYVTVDDFNNYHNMNLRDMLRSYSEDDSFAAERFLFKTEIKLMAWIDTVTFRRKRWDQLNAYQYLQFQLAILEQALYRYKNGDIDLDSGYDQDKGIIADKGKLNQLKVSSSAIEFLSNAGLYNLVVKNRPRTFSGITKDLNKF